MKIDIKFSGLDTAAIERDVRRNIEQRLRHVRCPVHGTGATMDEGRAALKEPCCDKLAEAVERALR